MAIRASVVLPEPDLPTSAVTSPCGTVNDTSASACRSPPSDPNRRPTSRTTTALHQQGDPAPAQRRPGAGGEGQDVLAVEADRAAGDAQALGEQPGDGPHGQRLAAAGLADHPDALRSLVHQR